MKYYVKELISDNNMQKTAGVKARDDVDAICISAGYQTIEIVNDAESHQKRKEAGLLRKIGYHKEVCDQWMNALSELKKGDSLVIQFPTMSHSMLLFTAIRKLHARGIRICLLIHDLELFRMVIRTDKKRSLKKTIRMTFEEKSILKAVDNVIVHNSKMKKVVADLGVEEKKIIELGIFDYLIPGADNAKVSACAEESYSAYAPVIIAGNLRPHKAAYAYHFGNTPEYNLYGVDYAHQQDNVHYFGAFPPDDLPFVMKGSYGLVWDGESTETCSGVFGEYLKMNNPHKTSLYLASGMPVAIWKQAALAEFIEENNCGIAIDSLNELDEKMKSITESEYAEMRKNALLISERLRTGAYTKKALETFISAGN